MRIEEMSERKVYVSIQLNGKNHLVGRLWVHHRKNKESASFEYDTAWLNNPQRFSLEPSLTLTEGAFHTTADKTLFGAIGDSAPDRWGRVLMRRAESKKAALDKKEQRTLNELDYLLGVYDLSRQGALRFSSDNEGPYLSPNEHNAIPPLVKLPRLLQATEHFIDDNENIEDLQLLLAPGSSLGGARPKASILGPDGKLAIAKFPHREDEFSTVQWEAVALTLAHHAGIETPKWWLEKVNGKSVLIIQRFDRNDSSRIPFLSAMSIIGAKDNEQHSYLELVDALHQYGAKPKTDIVCLWERIVFSILISNTDDHLRNHGFLYHNDQGWSLSPVYDINPTPTSIKARILTTAIDLDNGTASLDLALSVAKDFGLKPTEAKSIIQRIGLAVSKWKQHALTLGISNVEIDRMSSAFNHDELKKAVKAPL